MFINQNLVLFNNNINSGISTIEGISTLRISSKSIDLFYHFLYDNSTVCLDRKKEKFNLESKGIPLATPLNRDFQI